MKALPGNAEQQWDQQILADLNFIRKHKRYPIRRMTLMPLLSSGILLLFFARMMFVIFLTPNWSQHFSGYMLFLFVFLVPTVMSVRRYVDLIRFTEVPTPYFLAANMKLIQEFLKDNQLLMLRHSDAPEVFQIISRNISTVGEEREVLIFIADDRRILVNSHFTTSRRRFRMFSAPTHHREMIGKLKKWMAAREQPGRMVAR